MKGDALRSQTLWFYTLLGGFGIKKAAETVFPDLWSFSSSVGDVYAVFRFIVYFLLTVRFILGAVLYFDRDLIADRRAWLLDFVAGLAHFILLFTCAYQVNEAEIVRHLSSFQIAVSAVLMWDLLWWLICRDTIGRDQVRYWAAINTASVVLMVALSFGLSIGLGVPGAVARAISLTAILAVSLIDIIGMALQRELIAEWLQALIDGIKGSGGGGD